MHPDDDPTPDLDAAASAVTEAVPELEGSLGELIAPGAYPDPQVVRDAIEAAAAAMELRPVGDHALTSVVPVGWSTEVIDVREYEDRPRFKAGTFDFVGASFAAYVNRHRDDGGSTTLHAVDATDPVAMLTRSTVAMAAVFDDHLRGPALRRAENRQHRARLMVRPSPEAKRWGSVLGRSIGQEDLLDLATDGIGEIVAPDGAELRELVANLHATRSVDVESVIRTGGEGTIKLTENVKLRSGLSSEVTFPETITVRFDPFAFHDDTIEFTIRVKATVNQQSHRVQFFLAAPTLETQLLTVLDRIVADAQAATGLTAFWRPTAEV